MGLIAATIAGALKAHLEAAGTGVPWYRDGAPPEVVAGGKAYGVIQDGIGYAPERHGDYADPAAHQADVEQVQVDLYQPARVADAARAGATTAAESRTLHLLVRRALQGALAGSSWGTPARRIYGTTVVSGRRWPISDNTVRHTWTANVRRDT